MKRLALIFTLFVTNQVFANSPPPRPEEPKYAKARAEMVDKQLKSRGIKDESTIKAMLKVQRHEFAPEKYRDRAYNDTSLPIGDIQTISQPYMVALMTEAIRPDPNKKVLEIGTGTGYSTAVLAEIVGKVYSIEIEPELAKAAERRLKELGYTNTHVKTGDGFFGWEEAAPFDAIILTCNADKVPPKLADQLKESGRLIMPLGDSYAPQTMVVITKTNGRLVSRPLVEVQFVPMVGEIKK